MKAQVSAEFLVVVSVLMVLFIMFYVVVLSQNVNLFQAQDSLHSQRNAYGLSSAINYVHLAGDGAFLNYTLSGKENEDNITISSVSVESRNNRSHAVSPLLISDINTSSVEGGYMLIKNNAGGIEIEQ
jgi:hypothetical protein